MPEIDWRAKKRNRDKRVDTYSHPGVSQVIYRDEWGHKANKRTNNYNRTNGYSDSNNINIGGIILILVGVIISLYIVVSIILK
jgi:hypothetical protein